MTILTVKKLLVLCMSQTTFDGFPIAAGIDSLKLSENP